MIDILFDCSEENVNSRHIFANICIDILGFFLFRYRKCLRIGMTPNAVLSEDEKQVKANVRSNLCDLTCLRQLIRSKAVTNQPITEDCATISTMKR